MVGLGSPDIQVAPEPEKVSVPKTEPKPIGQRTKEMLERIRARMARSSPTPHAALAEIKSFPTSEPERIIPITEIPESSGDIALKEALPSDAATIDSDLNSVKTGEHVESVAVSSENSLDSPDEEVKKVTISEINPIIEPLYRDGKLDELLSRPDDIDAQIAAFVLIQGGHLGTRDNVVLAVKSLNFDLLSKGLGLSDQEREYLEQNGQALLRSIDDLRQLQEDEKYPYFERSKGHDEQIGRLYDQNDLFKNQFLFHIRSKLLLAPNTPENYKMSIIEGLDYASPYLQAADGSALNQQVNSAEDKVLAQIYRSQEMSEEMKNRVALTSFRRLKIDPEALTIMPISDLLQHGFNQDELFRATFGNGQINAEFIQTRLVPVFFPNENPEKVVQAWEILAKCTAYTTGTGARLETVDIPAFQDFLDNMGEIGGVVDVLSKYGFTYNPVPDKVSNPGTTRQDYIQSLKQLTADIPSLEQDILRLKEIFPDYRYTISLEQAFTTDGTIRYYENNPFVEAVKTLIWREDNINKRSSVDHTIGIINQMQAVVGEKWKDGFLRSVAQWACKGSFGVVDLPVYDQTEKTRLQQKLHGIGNKAISDPAISAESSSLIAMEYFNTSVIPGVDNIPALYKFLEKHADKVPVHLKDRAGWEGNADQTWLQFVLKSADLYRHQLGGENETQVRLKAIEELNFGFLAIDKIQDPTSRDQACMQLIYAYTDIDYLNLNRAIRLADSISDPSLQQSAKDEVNLEIEREEKGLSNSWKRLEKVRRQSVQNRQFLVDYLGFSSEEAQQEARANNKKIGFGLYDYHPVRENKEDLTNELTRIGDNMTISINMSWESVRQSLEAGRVLSAWENDEVLKQRDKDPGRVGKGAYAKRRDEIERLLSNRAKGGARDPHPIYGAALTQNGRDEFFGGVGDARYGECFVVLKTDRVKERTTFTYDDSFNGFSEYPLTWQDFRLQ